MRTEALRVLMNRVRDRSGLAFCGHPFKLPLLSPLMSLYFVRVSSGISHSQSIMYLSQESRVSSEGWCADMHTQPVWGQWAITAS